MKKPLGISPWVWGVGCLVLAGGVAAVKVARGDAPAAEGTAEGSTEMRSHLSVVEKKGVEKSEKRLELLVMSSNHAVHAILWAIYGSAKAERELEAQRTTGGAQLKAMELQEAKDKMGQAKKQYADQLGALRSEEKSLGLGNARSEAVEDYCSYGTSVANDAAFAEKYYGFSDPRTQDLLSRRKRVQEVGVEEMMRGDYKPADGGK